MRRIILNLCLVLGLLACRDSTGPGDDLAGSWDLVGYSDAGTPAVTSGTAVFRSNGTFSIDGTITFPGEPPDQLQVAGTWSIQGVIVILHTGGASGRWVLASSGNTVVLTLAGSQPPTTITLRRSTQ